MACADFTRPRWLGWVASLALLLTFGLTLPSVWAWSSRDAALAATLALTSPGLGALVVIDTLEHRLPNRLNAIAFAVVVTGVITTSTFTADGSLALRAATGMAVMGGFYLVLNLLGRGTGMGRGDVKLAPTLGALTAWAGLEAWVTSVMATFLAGGLVGLVLIAFGASRRTRIPFGPFMILGSLWAIFSTA